MSSNLIAIYLYQVQLLRKLGFQACYHHTMEATVANLEAKADLEVEMDYQSTLSLPSMSRLSPSPSNASSKFRL
ncbi:hypothetical protein Pint_19300 [Pistacia integerrima]|uniref:Uncharacterized protein n=1 Tax=Pistacia integerrima TaxID=434235 RepID=A0ACC0YXA6_9ROSI|nr:hypothetical protein Pint_19300 [Pistacia integerrima]